MPDPRGYDSPGPLLVVEVSETTLAYDRGEKLQLYARQQVPEYWIVNLMDRQLELHRDPTGLVYATTRLHRPGEAVTCLADPTFSIKVEQIMP